MFHDNSCLDSINGDDAVLHRGMPRDSIKVRRGSGLRPEGREPGCCPVKGGHGGAQRRTRQQMSRVKMRRSIQADSGAASGTREAQGTVCRVPRRQEHQVRVPFDARDSAREPAHVHARSRDDARKQPPSPQADW